MQNNRKKYIGLGILFLIAIILRIVYYSLSLGAGHKIPELRDVSNYLIWLFIILFTTVSATTKTRKE
ncbi:hypothetical protein [Flavobacterium pallidum]|uniref:Uncharacterized protein n=1 Tax=Flavobacterium pallidum TaxID=2172098 RepID=A0A2S1SET7_9FLAO|nr:hypothetical protein [Flavobacterium pallidum]AWI24918.1 hypothetical protein HYN49_02855 [Flavobacterium pallidum]